MTDGSIQEVSNKHQNVNKNVYGPYRRRGIETRYYSRVRKVHSHVLSLRRRM